MELRFLDTPTPPLVLETLLDMIERQQQVIEKLEKQVHRLDIDAEDAEKRFHVLLRVLPLDSYNQFVDRLHQTNNVPWNDKEWRSLASEDMQKAIVNSSMLNNKPFFGGES